jgi:hypothetical protein|tara:strand:+ start:2280 stop:2477 length:198 start_codon:yes stop_codon:yes gene_type:complete
MSKYKAIREQLRVEVDNKQQGTVDTFLRDIEQRHMQDEFCDQYVKLQDVGFSPYDCLIAFMKGNK